MFAGDFRESSAKVASFTHNLTNERSLTVLVSTGPNAGGERNNFPSITPLFVHGQNPPASTERVHSARRVGQPSVLNSTRSARGEPYHV